MRDEWSPPQTRGGLPRFEDLRIRGLSQHTIDTYVGAVARFARYFGRSPEALGKEDIRAFQVHLVSEKKVTFATLNVYTSALRFLYNVTLGNDWSADRICEDAEEATGRVGSSSAVSSASDKRDSVNSPHDD
jgi:hypothetical protein